MWDCSIPKPTNQTFSDAHSCFSVQELIDLNQDNPVEERPITDFNGELECSPWGSLSTLRKFLHHANRVNCADTSHPILVNQEGLVLDGLHRLAYAFLKGYQTVRVRVVTKYPPNLWEEKDLARLAAFGLITLSQIEARIVPPVPVTQQGNLCPTLSTVCASLLCAVTNPSVKRDAPQDEPEPALWEVKSDPVVSVSFSLNRLGGVG